MGLSAVFVIIPPPSGLAHRANDGLPAGVDVHMLDGKLDASKNLANSPPF
jgi:hypothetical protein